MASATKTKFFYFYFFMATSNRIPLEYIPVGLGGRSVGVLAGGAEPPHTGLGDVWLYIDADVDDDDDDDDVDGI